MVMMVVVMMVMMRQVLGPVRKAGSLGGRKHEADRQSDEGN
jgi:hypothetical protein